jgi:hypothetical protein
MIHSTHRRLSPSSISFLFGATALLLGSFNTSAQGILTKTQNFDNTAPTSSTYVTLTTNANATNSGSAGYYTPSFTQPGFGAFGSEDPNASSIPNTIPVVFEKQIFQKGSTTNKLTFELGQKDSGTGGGSGFSDANKVVVSITLNTEPVVAALTIIGPTLANASQSGPQFAIGSGAESITTFANPQTVTMGLATNSIPSQNAIGRYTITLPNFSVRTSVAVTITITSSKRSIVLIDNVTISSGSPLPVELTRFDATAKGTGVNLTWATATEKNSDRFEVQRSATGGEYNTIGTVKGQGSTSMAHNYSFVDSRPLAGTSYYRLRQVDTDGTFSFSPVVAVQAEASTKAMLYPNPSANQLILPAGVGMVQYRIFNSLGQTLLSGQATDNDRLDITSLPKGPFFLELSGATGHYTQRLMRQ